MDKEIYFEDALVMAQEIQKDAVINSNIFSVDIRTGGPDNYKYVEISVFPYRDRISTEALIQRLQSWVDVDKVKEYVAKHATKTEVLNVNLRIKYTTDGRLDSEQAMHTAADLVVNRQPASIENGVKVLDVETSEYSLQF